MNNFYFQLLSNFSGSLHLCRSVFWFCSVVIRGKGRGRAPCSGVEKCDGNAFRRPNPAALLGCFRRISHYFLVFFREKKEIPGFLWQCWPQFGILRLYGVEPAAWLRPKTRAAARRGHASAGGVPRRRTTCTNPPTRPSRTGAPCGRP